MVGYPQIPYTNTNKGLMIKIKKSKKGLAPFSLGYIVSGKTSSGGGYIFSLDDGQDTTLSPAESVALRWDIFVGRQLSPELIRIPGEDMRYAIRTNEREHMRLKKGLGITKPKEQHWMKKPVPETLPLFK